MKKLFLLIFFTSLVAMQHDGRSITFPQPQAEAASRATPCYTSKTIERVSGGAVAMGITLGCYGLVADSYPTIAAGMFLVATCGLPWVMKGRIGRYVNQHDDVASGGRVV